MRRRQLEAVARAIGWTALFVLVPGAAAAAAIHVPSCAQFVEYGQKWVGLDEAFAAQVLGVPLYALTDADIALIEQTLRDCAHAAATAEERTLLEEDLRHVSLLRSARARVSRALADFDRAKKKAQPKLEQLAAKIDALPATASSRAAIEDAQATVSAIFFELEQKRLQAQVKAPLAEDYPPYSTVMAALARKREAYGAQAQKQLFTEAAEAMAQHGPEVERLGLPPAMRDAAIILEDIDAGRDVRWLTLRQWTALALSNSENTSVSVLRHPHADSEPLIIEIVRPGYGRAEFAFRRERDQLRIVQSGLDGRLLDIDTPERRREAIILLLAVATQR